MNPQQIVSQATDKFKAQLEHFDGEIKKLRTGRAHPSMLDGVVVQAYGTPMPLNQVATITTPEAQLIQITPFDPSNSNDSSVTRLTTPDTTFPSFSSKMVVS